jgi:glycosyltransferase involved in cell wall biosynthesis
MAETEEPLVSIIMNCYNGEKFLPEAIKSVLAQTYTNWELIFWDNQSTDNSADILKSCDDNRLKYYYAPKHALLYEARNYAIEKATGELYAFLDVDDWWLPEKLEVQVPLFSDPEVGLVCSNFRVVNEIKESTNNYWKGQKPSGWILNALLKDYFVGLLTIVIRRVSFESLASGFDNRYHVIGDFDLTIRIAENWKIDCVQETLAYFRFHGKNESVLHKELHIKELETWLDEMKKHSLVSAQDGFSKKADSCLYLKALYQMEQNKVWEAVKLFWGISIGMTKFKLLVAIILPKTILKTLRA